MTTNTSFLGQQILFEVFSPNLQNLISEPVTATVTEEVEFPRIANFDRTDDSSRVVNAILDLDADTISYTVDDSSGRFSSVPEFNGYVLTDVDDTLASIVGVEIVENSLGLAEQNVFFNDDSVFVDVDGLRFARGLSFTLEVDFADPDSLLAPTEDAIFVARLYTASLGRDPDEAGLNFWYDVLIAQDDRMGLIGNFLFSPEFEDRFGDPETLTDRDYVLQLYQNILQRDSDAAGANFWTGLLQNDQIDRVDTLGFFVESPENVENTERFDDFARNVETDEWVLLI